MKQTHKLLLLRHAESAWDKAVNDFDRGLTVRGKNDIKAVAQWMDQQAQTVDRVVCSPAVRTRLTATCLFEQLQSLVEQQQLHYEAAIYNASVDDLIDVLSRQADTVHTLMLVGHNPGLERLLSLLTGQPHAPIEPATLIVLELNTDWNTIMSQPLRLLHRFQPH